MKTTANSKKTVQKAKPRSYKPGVSGNPAGRPKKTSQELDLIAACKDKTPQALSVISDIMTNGEKEQTRLAAALAIIERAYGKPVQPTDVNLSGAVQAKIIIEYVRPKHSAS